MPTFSVNVKWGKEKFKDVEANTDEDPDVFRAQLFCLTGVQPEDQKVMCKGKTLKDSWEGFPVKAKANVLLMGTASEAKVDEPEEKDIVFAEDLPKTAVKDDLPLGLVNVGNTCYMNSVLQCFRSTDVVQQAIASGDLRVGGSALYTDVAALFTQMASASDRTRVDQITQLFWTHLRSQYPQFAETRNGVPAQQDAGEFWVILGRMFNESMPYSGTREGQIAQYFGIDRRETTACVEAIDESPEVTVANEQMLSCHIDRDVGYVSAGLKKAMEEEITKHCAALSRDAPYIKKKEIVRLPEYLTVQLVRFYFKREAQENCKIRKDVKFSMTLDVYELCAPDFQEKLKPARDKFNEFQDWEAEQNAALAGKRSEGKEITYDLLPSNFEDDPGSNNSGKYELHAVLTHKGRSSDSGHYVAWVKDENVANKWYLFDDKKVSVHTDADILKLSGGGDWHTAYFLLYKASKCRKIPESLDAADADATTTTATTTSSSSSGMDTAKDE